jgi:uncharacterized CHY-type Zn-finger protein
LDEISAIRAMTNFKDVRGVNLDSQTRCDHYRGPADVIAIKMKCCGVYYACMECHLALAGHAIEVWPERDWNQIAVLCGACGTKLTIREYIQCESRCPSCNVPFNPGCRNHYHFYFEHPPLDIELCLLPFGQTRLRDSG